jgi:hypothetical protein
MRLLPEWTRREPIPSRNPGVIAMDAKLEIAVDTLCQAMKREKPGTRAHLDAKCAWLEALNDLQRAQLREDDDSQIAAEEAQTERDEAQRELRLLLDALDLTEKDWLRAKTIGRLPTGQLLAID